MFQPRDFLGRAEIPLYKLWQFVMTEGGLRVEEAAKRTWTGKRATSKGYTEVTVVRALPTGAQGQYQEVIVQFRRP